MRLRSWRRRLTVGAPRMVVRSALPWPFRWAIIAIVFGFCCSIGLWAFELGRDIAGLDRDAKDEIQSLKKEISEIKTELDTTKQARDEAQSIANTADTLVATEKASRTKLEEQVKQLEAQNQSLRDDLGFFEKLIPASNTTALSIRGIQVDKVEEGQYKWQVMIIQPVRGAPEFSGKLEVVFAGVQDAKPWTAGLPDGGQAIKINKYGRVEGRVTIPSQVVLKSVTVRVLDGGGVRATQTQKL
ncbi:hypothetical protein KIK84_06105 [Curvibacter sp. CHRR-16]|nr:hypothetical protein [Curvibacter sp. CHRR-16]